MRRNPVIADIFAQFTITFPNIIEVWREEHPDAETDVVDDIKGGTQAGTQAGTQGGTQAGTQGDDLDRWIEYQVIANPEITTEELASLSNKGIRTIKRHIAKMPHIRYVGSGYSGHWEVNRKEKDL